MVFERVSTWWSTVALCLSLHDDLRNDVASVNLKKFTSRFLRIYSVAVLGRELIVYVLILFWYAKCKQIGRKEVGYDQFCEDDKSRPVLDLRQWLFRFFRPVFQSCQNSIGVLMISSLPCNGYLFFCGDKAAGAWCWPPTSLWCQVANCLGYTSPPPPFTCIDMSWVDLCLLSIVSRNVLKLGNSCV